MIKLPSVNLMVLAFVLDSTLIPHIIAAATITMADTAQSVTSDVSTASATVAGESTDSASASASANSTETSCSYDGSVGTYLSCEKNKISTGVLVGAGIGITLGIFILAFGCIWASKRRGGKGKGKTGSGSTVKIIEDEEGEEGYEHDYGKGIELESPKAKVTTVNRDIRSSPHPPGSQGRRDHSPKTNGNGTRNGRPSRSRYVDNKGFTNPTQKDKQERGWNERSDSVHARDTDRRPGFAPNVIANADTTKQNVSVNDTNASTTVPRQLYPCSSSSLQYTPGTGQSSNARPISSRASTVSSMRSTPPSYTSNAPPLPAAPIPASSRQSVHSHIVRGHGGIYAGSARPSSNVSTVARTPKGNLAGVGARASMATTQGIGNSSGQSNHGKAGVIPPVPSLPSRPPTRVLRTESEAPPIRHPTTYSDTEPNRLTGEEPDAAALRFPVAEKPQRQGSTAPLNVPSRKSMAISNFIPSYYQSSEDQVEVDPLDTKAAIPLPPPISQTHTQAQSQGNNSDSKMTKNRNPPASRYIPRRPSDYASSLTSTSSKSERASGSSESGLVKPITPFKGGIETNGVTKESQGGEKKKPVRKYTQGAVI